jgi:hypothetical protein
LFAPMIILEVGMQTSWAMGSSRSQAVYVQGPNARLAGILRLALTALVLALFSSYR